MTYLRALLGAAVVAGCGLISSDVTNFDLTLPDKSFSVDVSSYQIDPTAVKAFQTQSCATTPSICSSAATAACKANCAGSCDASTKTCDLALKVSVYAPVDIGTEKPEIKTVASQPVIKVGIDAVTYEVTTNTLNVPTPELTVYVAPMSVIDPNDPSAMAIGTIAPIQPMKTTSGPQPMVFTATGQQTLANIMGSWKTPFNVIVGGTVQVMMATPVPSGKLDAVVHIKAHAGL
jgi:hypothetical protein